MSKNRQLCEDSKGLLRLKQQGACLLVRHSEWSDSALLFARNPKLLWQRYYAKEFAQTRCCNCSIASVQLQHRVCANNPARQVGHGQKDCRGKLYSFAPY